MAKDPKLGFDLEKAIKELTDLGVVEQVTMLQERRERLAQMPRPREIMLMPISKIPKKKLREYLKGPTEEEEDYVNLYKQLSDYEKNHEQFPERYQNWEKPRIRLKQKFLEVVASQMTGEYTELYTRAFLKVARS